MVFASPLKSGSEEMGKRGIQYKTKAIDFELFIHSRHLKNKLEELLIYVLCLCKDTLNFFLC